MGKDVTLTLLANSLVRNRDGDPASLLGLGGNDHTTPQIVDRAVRGGINFLFFYSTRFEGMVEGVRYACRDRRDSLVVATGTEDRSPDAIKRYADGVSEQTGIDEIDVFFAEYVSPEENLDTILGVDGALCAIEALKSESRVRYVGVSVHDRALGERLITTGRFDVVMHRYNMAHRKSEMNLLPAALELEIPVVAFTCTRWGSLLNGHRAWKGRVPSAGDCYQFALANPAVQIAMTAPASIEDLDSNLRTLDANRGKEKNDPGDWWEYGDLIYGEGTDAFETRWP